jgi:hypothetical protein
MSTTTHTATATATTKRSVRQFVRHYIEMVIAMFAGMIVLGLPAEAGLRLVGTSTGELKTAAPEIVLLGMAIIMTIPMVGWMRHRGHTWRPCHEMAASMIVPTAAIIGLMWAGVMTDFGTLMLVEHIVMLPAMLAVMLLRIDEYAGCHHGDHGAETALA